MALRLRFLALALLVSSAALAQEGDVYGPPPVLFSWGIDGAIGYSYPAQALDLAFDVRFGAQLNPLLGVYVDLGGTGGLGLSGTGNVSNGGGSFSVSALGFWHVAPMVEFDFNKFFVAVGPMIAGGGWAQGTEGVDAAGNSYSQSLSVGGLMPGADVRIGLTFGERAPWGRLRGFTLALDLKLMVGHVDGIAGNAPNPPALGQAVFAFTPTLTLGFDAR